MEPLKNVRAQQLTLSKRLRASLGLGADSPWVAGPHNPGTLAAPPPAQNWAGLSASCNVYLYVVENYKVINMQWGPWWANSVVYSFANLLLSLYTGILQ